MCLIKKWNLIAERINYKTIVRSAIIANRSIKSFIINATCYNQRRILKRSARVLLF